MIREWRLANFKSIKQRMTPLGFGALTIIAGGNSSGKSTLIQSILLIMQTLASEDRVPLLLNGDLVKLGTVEDMWHKGEIAIPLEIDFLIDDKHSNTSYRYAFTFGARTTNPESTAVVLNRAEYGWYGMGHSELEARIIIERDNHQHTLIAASDDFIRIREAELIALGLRNPQPPVQSRVELDSLLLAKNLVQGEGKRREENWSVVLNDPLNIEGIDNLTDLIIPTHYVDVIESAIIRLDLPPLFYLNKRTDLPLGQYVEWFKNLQTAQARHLQDLYAERLNDLTEELSDFYTLSLFEASAKTALLNFTQRIRYLSAHRVEPTALFNRTRKSRWSEVGIDGSQVAAALHEYGGRSIVYWDVHKRDLHEAPLMEAVLSWLDYFALVDGLRTHDYGKLGTFLSVQAPGWHKELDLTALGFGTSQLLPIIVQGLLTPDHGGLFIVEQPEVHLHPNVQGKLAVFFMALTRTGVRCIVETHSEHILNRLRLLVVKTQFMEAADIEMYFAEQNPTDGTHYERVIIDAAGQIQNWPDGFLDEGSKLAQELMQSLLNSPRLSS